MEQQCALPGAGQRRSIISIAAQGGPSSALFRLHRTAAVSFPASWRPATMSLRALSDPAELPPDAGLVMLGDPMRTRESAGFSDRHT